MVTYIDEYKASSEFAKEYKGKLGKRKGVNRTSITKLINAEIANPGSTGVDVIVIGGQRFVRYSDKTDTNKGDINSLIRSIINKME